MPMTGGLSNACEADDKLQGLCDQVRGELENQISKKFTKYEAVLVKRQCVAGTNHFAKIHVGGEEYVHVRIFEALPCHGGEVTLHGYQSGKTKEDDIVHF